MPEGEMFKICVVCLPAKSNFLLVGGENDFIFEGMLIVDDAYTSYLHTTKPKSTSPPPPHLLSQMPTRTTDGTFGRSLI